MLSISKREELWKKARQNTKVNQLGQTTISREDYTFYDEFWDEVDEVEDTQKD